MTKVIGRSAVLSLDGRHRPELRRLLATGSCKAMWCGVNPSIADAELDDASIRKLYGFGERLDIGEWMVGNLADYRATDPKELGRVPDPISQACDRHLLRMMDEADLIIVGWGRIDKMPKHLRGRWRDILIMADLCQKPVMCWGTCGDGHPRHPLFVPYETPLEEWKEPPQ